MNFIMIDLLLREALDRLRVCLNKTRNMHLAFVALTDATFTARISIISVEIDMKS